MDPSPSLRKEFHERAELPQRLFSPEPELSECRLEPAPNEGLSGCSYARGRDHDGNICVFAKLDHPRVATELKNLIFLQKKGWSSPIAPLAGSSVGEMRLLLPAIEQPNWGLDLVLDFNARRCSEAGYLRSWRAALDTLAEVYALTPEVPRVGHNQMLADLLEREMANLHLVPLAQLARLGLPHPEEFLSAPIRVSSEEGLRELPCLRQMMTAFKEMVMRFPEVPARMIHGDFHGPNVGWHQGRAVLFDWSDLDPAGDPCFDLGRWINYHERFFTAAVGFQQRHSPARFHYSNGVIEIHSELDSYRPMSPAVREAMREDFAQLIAQPVAVVEARSRAAEFLSCVIRIPWRIRMLPESVATVLACSAESYVNLQRCQEVQGETQ